MIILTGAAGFIGHHLVEKYKNSHRLLLVDLPDHFRARGFLDGIEASLTDWASGKESSASQHKIIDRNYFLKVLEAIGPEAPKHDPKAKEHVLIPPGEKIDCVLHIGACTDTAESRWDYLTKWNIDYSKAIWNWCTKHRVPLVYASSAATYGNGEHGFRDDWETTHKLKPLNLYGQSKHDFDLWVHGEAQAGRTPPSWQGLKFFNVYGPHEAHKGNMIGPVLVAYRHILRTGKCRLFRSHNPDVKDGEQSRDFIHVQDIVNLVDFMRTKQPKSGLYNCGTGQARTFLAMMQALCLALDKPLNIDWIDTPLQYRKAYQYFTEADMSSALREGYNLPFTSLEMGVAHYVDWLKQNEKVSAEILLN